MAATDSTLEGTIRGKWWILLLLGLFTAAAGILALAYPHYTLLILGIIFGAYLVVWGTFTLFVAFAPDEPAGLRVLSILVGFFAILAGLFCLVRPGASVLVLVIALGFWFCLVGVADLVRGFDSRAGRFWNILLGLLAIAAGVLVLANPDIGLKTLALLVGIGLVARGVVEMAMGAYLKLS